MQKFIVAALLAAGLITTPAMAADAPAAKATQAYIAGSAIRTDAEVMSIDLPSRKVGLKLEDGTIAQVVVGKEVRNLAQVKVGDHVVAEYARAVSLKLKKGPGLRVTEEMADGARAAPGEKPAAIVGSETHFVADVVTVNTKAKKISIKGAKGNVYELKIKDADLLSQIKVGDQVEGTYLQVMAIGVMAPTAK